ncbi:MAG: hypothetical protein A2X12_10365 [Bacteroidetes bacterium GWE2_29_8]|nr:MAG: hypothetical protein A2X12_10365 [Bacteroidetes bacterium GWE2_29_8]OFY20273.1 MAG: hypothetical protein A2X02_05310 [Bacteroidetes bacterium GWF2_29_10]
MTSFYKKYKVIFIVVFITTQCFLFFTACKSYYDLYRTNISYLYKQEDSYFKPNISINKENDDLFIYYTITASQVSYFKTDENSKYNYSLQINYLVYDYEFDKKMLDSATVYINDSIENISLSKIENKVKINTPEKDFKIKIVLTDIISKNSYVKYFNVIKSKIRGDYYLLYENDNINNDNIIHVNTLIGIENKYAKKKKLIAEYFNNNFEIAPPPHASNSRKLLTNLLKYDSTFALNFNEANNRFEFNPTKTGIYKIYLNEEENLYLSLFCFAENYPAISNVNEMLNSIRYITSKKEFEQIQQTEEIKNKIDTFWIENTGNKERAREMIKKYYTGVQNANRLFTSYYEGWKTDRGMIYIVLGAPHIVYKSINSETWIYGNEKSLNSMNFTFNKVENPFSDNDFELFRLPIYANYWFVNIDTWRR